MYVLFEKNSVQRIKREIRIWNTLDHENVLRLLGVTDRPRPGDRTVALVSIFMRKGNLKDYYESKLYSIDVLSMVIAYFDLHDIL